MRVGKIDNFFFLVTYSFKKHKFDYDALVSFKLDLFYTEYQVRSIACNVRPDRQSKCLSYLY